VVGRSDCARCGRLTIIASRLPTPLRPPIDTGAGDRGGSSEIRYYLQDTAGRRSLVFDLSMTHDRFGSSSQKSQKKRLPAIAMDFFQSFLMHVSTAPKTVVGHGQVEDQASTSRCVLEVVADLNVAAPLACACRYRLLFFVSARTNKRHHHHHRRAACGPCVRPCETAALALLPSNHSPWYRG
jgi:hypothetical protein